MAALEPWPSLHDPEYIDFMQQYPSRLCKRTSRVLRKFAHGFIACKFSALAYLIIGILWLDRSKTKEEKIAMMIQFDVKNIGSFKNQQLESIFMHNQRADPSKVINDFHDIVFEDNIALFGIVEGDGYSIGQVYHFFVVLEKPNGHSIVSSYGNDSLSIYQYETEVTPESFIDFINSLKKDNKSAKDVSRIRGFMRAHFLNPDFKLHQRKSEEFIKETVPDDLFKNSPEDIRAEIDRYVGSVSHVVQFKEILPAIQDELSHHTSIAEAEEAEGGMRQRRTRKGKRTHYVRSRNRNDSLSYTKRSSSFFFS
jgi:hypothetical protein